MADELLYVISSQLTKFIRADKFLLFYLLLLKVYIGEYFKFECYNQKKYRRITPTVFLKIINSSFLQSFLLEVHYRSILLSRCPKLHCLN